MKYCGVYRRGDSPYWYIYFPNPATGVRKQAATPYLISDPQGYRKALDEAMERGKAGLVSKKHLGHEVWEQWVDGFIQRHYLDPKSHQRADIAWRHWRAYLTTKEIPVPRAMDYAKAIGYLEWRLAQKRWCGKPISKNTVLTEIKVMSTIMREAVKLGFASANPCAQLGIKRDAPKKKLEITDEDIATIREKLPKWAAANQQEWMVNAFEVAIHQGCRLRETRVPLRDIDLRRMVITFRAKGGKEFATALHPGLKPLIERLKKAKATYTCDEIPLLASKHFREFFDSLDMPYSFHCTRITAVTKLARAGISQQQAMAFIGHSSEVVHSIYQRLQPTDLGAVAAAIKF